MKKAQYVQTIALSLVIIGSLSFVSKNISNSQHLLTAQAAAPTQNLVAYYSFDTDATDSVGGNNGTINGAAFTTGKVNGALQFDGVNDYVGMGAPAALDITGAVSVSAWVNLDSSALNRKIAGKGITGSGSNEWQYQIYDAGNNNLGFRVSNNTTLTGCRSQNGEFAPGTWKHVVGTYNGSDTVRVYVDGVQVCSTTATGFGALRSVGNFTVGASSGGDWGFVAGKIDEVRVYVKALDQAEVTNLFNSGGTSDGSTPPPPVIIPPNPPADTGSATTSPPSAAGTYYVSPTGSDSNPGTQSLPFKTVQRAANAVAPGNVVVISPGTYPEFVNVSRSGTSAARITFQGTKDTTIVGGFWITGAYITVKDMTLNGYGGLAYSGTLHFATGGDYGLGQNLNIIGTVSLTAGPAGVRMYKSSPTSAHPVNDTIDGVSIINSNHHAFSLAGSGHVIKNSYITGQNGWDVFDIFSSNTVISGNRVIEWNNPAGNPNHPDIFQTFSTDPTIVSKNVIIENNYINGAVGDVQFGNLEDQQGNNISDWTFRNNVFANIERTMNLYIQNTSFYNNVFYRVGYASNWAIIYNSTEANKGSANGLKIKNNMFVHVAGDNSNTKGWYGGTPITGFEADYNLVVGTGSQLVKSGFNEAHGVNGFDPQFVNLSGGDFKLQATSPAINKGTTLAGFSVDKDGVARPQGSAWDIGAHEYMGSGEGTLPKQGDFNGDGLVNTIDFSYMNNKWNTADATADLNKDGRVNTLDFSIMSRNWTN